MIQPYQTSNRNQSGSNQPQRSMNQMQTYQNNMDSNQMMMSAFGDDPFFGNFQQMQGRMLQNFQNMTQMMIGGSGFSGNQMFPSLLMSNEFNEDDVFGFSDLHKQMSLMPMQLNQNSEGADQMGNGQFQVFSRSMVQKQVIGPDGKPKLEKYYNDNMISRGNDGNTISEKKQAYHNQGSGRSILAHEKMLNDQGHKYIKQRNQQGEVEEQNLYNNIEEEQAQQFHERWNNQRTQVRQLANEPTRYMQIQHQPNQQYQAQQRPQLQQQLPQYAVQQPQIRHQIPQGSVRSVQQKPPSPAISQASSYSRPMSGISHNQPSSYVPISQQQRIQTPLSYTSSQKISQQDPRLGSPYSSQSAYSNSNALRFRNQ